MTADSGDVAVTLDDGHVVIMNREEILASRDALLGLGKFAVNAATGKEDG